MIKQENFISNIFKALMLSFAFLFLSACASDKDQDKSSKEAKDNKVVVGAESAYYPFTFLKDGRMEGFDIDVVRLLASKDKDLELEFKAVPWEGILLGLDSSRFDMVANQMTKSPQREEKYIFSKEPYFVLTSEIMVRKDSKINDVQDLKGKKIGVLTGSSHTKVLEQWNKENGNILEVVFYKDLSSILNDLSLGRIDAIINDRAGIFQSLKKNNLEVKALPTKIATEDVFFIFPKSNTILRDKIDNALLEIKNDGSLKELSIKWFGIDRTK